MWRDIRFQVAVLTFVTTGAGAIAAVATQATGSIEGKITFWLLAGFMLVSLVYVSAPIWASPARDVRRHVRRWRQSKRDKRDFFAFRSMWFDMDAFLRSAMTDYLNPPRDDALQEAYSRLRRPLQTFRGPVLDQLYVAVKRGAFPEIGGIDYWGQHLLQAISSADNPFAVFYTDPDLVEQWGRLFQHRDSFTMKALHGMLDRIKDAMVGFGADLGLGSD